MKKLLPVIILFSVLLSFTIASFAQSKTVSKKDAAALTKIYQDFDDADKKLDLKRIEKYLGDDYSLESGKEKFSKKQTLERLKTFFSAVKEISEAKSTIEKIELAGGKYTLQVTSTTKGKMALPNGRVVDIFFTSKSTDFWRKGKENKWQEFKQIDRGTKTVIDGKEIPAN